MKDHYWEAAEQLRGENGYPYEMMPLLYAIIKSAKGNFPEANKLIQEGTEKHATTDYIPTTDSVTRDSDSRSSCNNDDGNIIRSKQKGKRKKGAHPDDLDNIFIKTIRQYSGENQ